MPVQHKTFADERAFRATLDQHKSQLVVVDFSAAWCGPCQFIKPHFEALADEFTDVAFLELDVDENEDVTEALGVSAMPTFQFWRDGKLVDVVRGADPRGLKQKIAQLQ
ncbi:Aste57867_22177 [Aphanomyces stellatus]|uniref:Thioredoxin n=1 Tax=Aphanomyces stellatus TaxID=120398 RepID=A0A485LL33_9STRA|nr:hypothetical protein As57867_022108 [Aphanomyces stellatus]KAF0686152.1 hypothetical protein As57867_021935 [Aphanomyces stellatus]KAF0703477.1 hypothetical protein As57867_007600 [Aphanomyces stellatus]VFT84534.1 Aste57867_7627 [Aphanomyces stellatus]VFT98672.1 Aste57867_22004 [Aphanomyces stellatus]